MKSSARFLPGQAFLTALGLAAILFLPFVISDGGYFIYYGDFNVQQIPFYQLAHDAVRSGDVLWNWHTDLGANFIGSYSFYLLFSPFFWLTLPFPNYMLPFLMAPLLVIKTACAALTAYYYLYRFVRDKRYAVFGSLLYAFSGWMSYNIFFNHFHEAAVFFPLLLIGVEKLVMDGNRGFFIFAVLINAVVNYWFFAGEAVFVILYVVLRMTDPAFRSKITVRRFLQLGFESALGVGLAAFALMPSVMALIGNPRTSLSEILSGWGLWLYWHEQRQPAILQSMFFPPDLASYPNFFPGHGARWASLSAWLPMIGMTGVLTYFSQRRGDWLKRMLWLCLVIALIPGLNSMFVLLNHSYYARWFYMPILLMSLATIRGVEDSDYDLHPMRRSLLLCGLITAAFAIMCGLTPQFSDGALTFGLANDMALLWFYTAVAGTGLALSAAVLLKLRRHPRFFTLLCAAMALIVIIFNVAYIYTGKTKYERSDYIIDTVIGGRGRISLPDTPFVRADAYDATDNLLMFWRLPNIQAFHSIVPPSIMEFYPAVGVKRDVSSRPDAESYALRSLLSVRWLFIESSAANQEPMPGYAFYSSQMGFNIYENENFIPIGFAYNRFMDRTELEEFPPEYRANMMLKAVVLDEGAIQRNKGLLEPFNLGAFISEDGEVLNADSLHEQFVLDSRSRRGHTVHAFHRDNAGFTAHSSFEEPKLIFFSVPWDAGWSATVNGSPVRVEKANIGFMAVRVPEGESVIRFDYMTPGLYPGFCVTAISAALALAYLFIANKGRKNQALPVSDIGGVRYPGEHVRLTEAEYREQSDAKRRAGKLSRTLNEAAARHVDEEIPPQARTLRFTEPEDSNTTSSQTNR